MLGNVDALVRRLQASGREDIAERVLRAEAGEFRPDLGSWFDLAVTLQQVGEIEAAINSYGSILAIDYTDWRSHANLANLLCRAGRYTSAWISLRAVVKNRPDDFNFYYSAAHAAWRAGLPREAMKLLDASIAADVDVAQCLDLKARLLLQDQRFDQVIRLAEASWPRVEPDFWACHGVTHAYDSALYAIGRGAEGPISGKNPDLTLERVREAWRQLTESCPRFAALLPIHVVGDSHTTFFTGLNYHQFCSTGAPQVLSPFKAYNIGAKLVYTLDKKTSRGDGFFDFLSTGKVPPGSAVMLSFGEIDTRVHVLEQVDRQGRRLDDIQQELVDIYVDTVERVRALGFRPLIWAPIGGAPDDNPDSYVYPAKGTMVERNRLRWDFIVRLAGACIPRGVPVISVFRGMVDDAMTTDATWLMDGLHLSQKAMTLTIAAFHGTFR